MEDAIQVVSDKSCGCGEDCSCSTETKQSLLSHLTKDRGNEEIAFAFLLALTPLLTLSLFGQIGLF
jgi:hypothetical protein